MLATSIFQTPPPLVHTMLERALAAGVPATWVTGDAGYGHDRTWRLGMASWPQAYEMAVPVNEPVWRGFQQLRVPWLIARARGQRQRFRGARFTPMRPTTSRFPAVGTWHVRDWAGGAG
jgi:SRSO17 transposase